MLMPWAWHPDSSPSLLQFTVSDYLCQCQVFDIQTFLVKNHEKNGFVKCVTDQQTAI
jgi:hypothetical protein